MFYAKTWLMCTDIYKSKIGLYNVAVQWENVTCTECQHETWVDVISLFD